MMLEFKAGTANILLIWAIVPIVWEASSNLPRSERSMLPEDIIQPALSSRRTFHEVLDPTTNHYFSSPVPVLEPGTRERSLRIIHCDMLPWSSFDPGDVYLTRGQIR